MSQRIKFYKNSAKTEKKLRDGRLLTQVELRKLHREETLQKYRILTAPTESVANETEDCIDMNNLKETFHTIKQNHQLLMDLISTLKNTVSEIDAKKDSFIKYRILPIMVECLTYDSYPQVQYETAYAFGKIALRLQINAVAQSGAVPQLIRLLESMDSKVCEIAAWALGNIVGDSSELRDYAINCGVLSPLLKLISADISIYNLKTVSRAIKKLCRHTNSPPSKSTISEMLPTLQYLIRFRDVDVLFETLWALSYLSRSGNDIIAMLIEADFVRCLIPLMVHSNFEVQMEALGIICKITKGTDEQTQHIFDSGALSYISTLLNHSENRINCKAMRILSNITAGTEAQIQAVIDHGLIPLVVQHLNIGDLRTQKEAVWVVKNLSYCGSREQIAYLVRSGIIPPLCQMLSLNDTSTTENVLDSLDDIIEAAREESEIVCQYIEECGGLDLIAQLQHHENDHIYERAYRIMANYTNPELDPMNENDEITVVGPQKHIEIYNYA